MNANCHSSSDAPEHRKILLVFPQEARDILQHPPIQLAYLQAYPHKQKALASRPPRTPTSDAHGTDGQEADGMIVGVVGDDAKPGFPGSSPPFPGG